MTNPRAAFRLHTSCALFVILPLAAPSAQERAHLVQRGGGPIGNEAPCVSPEEQAALDGQRAQFSALGNFSSPLVQRPKFTFYPMGATLYRDVYLLNYVDLDPSASILTWDCERQSYNGHRGHDTDLRSFAEQEIGVPIFAALDGVVTSTHDGEDDHNTSCTGNTNHVRISHAGGRSTEYYHMRRNSVAVTVGQVVRAGQQIGLVASSGCSSYPHLHFETHDVNQVVEPHAGPCRAGESLWIDQPPERTDLYASDFNLTSIDIGATPGLPYDMPRQGTWLSGLQHVNFWTIVHHQPPNNTWRVVFRRPDGSTYYDSGTVGPFIGSPFYHWSWWWWGWTVYLDQLGTWNVSLYISGTEIARAPFDVVASPGDVVNRPPNSIDVALEPSAPTRDDVLICRVQSDLVLDDPDYDVVRYRYQWYVNGNLVRDIVSAGLADMLPHHTAPHGAIVDCVVTTSDGIVDGPAAMDTVALPWPTRSSAAPGKFVTR